MPRTMMLGTPEIYLQEAPENEDRKGKRLFESEAGSNSARVWQEQKATSVVTSNKATKVQWWSCEMHVSITL